LNKYLSLRPNKNQMFPNNPQIFGAGAGRGGAVFGNGGFAGAGRGALFGGGMAPAAPMGNGLFNPPKQEASQFPGHAQAQAQAQGNLQFGVAAPVFGAGAPPANNAAGIFGANPAPVFGGAAPNVFGAAPAGGQQPAQQAFGFGQAGTQPQQAIGFGFPQQAATPAAAGTFAAGNFQFGAGAQAQPKANAGQQANALSVFTTQQAPQDDFPYKNKFSELERMYAPVIQKVDRKYADIPLDVKRNPKSKKEIIPTHRWNDECQFEFAYYVTKDSGLLADLDRVSEPDGTEQDLVGKYHNF
jgi:hypothetical protein